MAPLLWNAHIRAGLATARVHELLSSRPLGSSLTLCMPPWPHCLPCSGGLAP